jgi:hypothetical protein
MKAGKTPARAPVGAAARPLRSKAPNRNESRLETSGKPPAQPPPERAAAGCGPPRRPGTAWSKGRGDSLKMVAQAARTASPAVRAKRFGALEGGASSTRECESVPGKSAPDREAKFLRDWWAVGPRFLVNTRDEIQWNCPAAKASRTSEAPAIECESMTTGDRRRTVSAKAEADSIRRGRMAIPGRCAASGNGAARASPQRWAIPDSNPGNWIGIKGAHADSGLRRNRSPKTRKGREWYLEPGRKLPLGGAEETGAEIGEARFQPPGWLTCRTGIGPKGRKRSLPVSTGELDQ